MAASLGDYYNTLEFTQSELRESREELAAIRSDPAKAERIKILEHEISLLEQGVDRYQKQIKILQHSNPLTPCSPSIS